MVLSLIFGRKYARSQVGTVLLDAVLSEEHNFRARVTNYPIENGTFVSDHVIKDPFTLTISGIVSDTPLNIFTLGFRSDAAFQRLIDIYERRERISVVTGIRTYVDMIITSLNVPRDLSTGQSLTFNIELQKVILDTSVRLFLGNQNDPFDRPNNVIPREQVANADKYPFVQADPVTSLKDQASSSQDIGIQQLLIIPPEILTNVPNFSTTYGALL